MNYSRRILICVILFLGIQEGYSQKRKSGSGSTRVVTSPTSFSCPDFREMKWGTSKDSIFIGDKNIQFVRAGNKNDTSAYIISGDNMVIGTVVCRNIYYYFNPAGRLNKVKLEIPKQHKGEIKYILTSKFEEPSSFTPISNGYLSIWNNIEEVRIVLTYFEDPLDFLTVEFISEFELNESKKINRAVDDF